MASSVLNTTSKSLGSFKRTADQTGVQPIFEGEESSEIGTLLIGSFQGEPGDDDGSFFGQIILTANGSFVASPGVESTFAGFLDIRPRRGIWGISTQRTVYQGKKYLSYELILKSDMGPDELLEDRINVSELTSNGFLLHNIPTSQRFRRIPNLPAHRLQDCPFAFPGHHAAVCHDV